LALVRVMFSSPYIESSASSLPPPVWENPLGLGSYHTDIDLAGSTGTRIQVATSGNVVFVGKDQYGGKYIDIDHGGGLKTHYLHLSIFAVSVGNQESDIL